MWLFWWIVNLTLSMKNCKIKKYYWYQKPHLTQCCHTFWQFSHSYLNFPWWTIYSCFLKLALLLKVLSHSLHLNRFVALWTVLWSFNRLKVENVQSFSEIWTHEWNFTFRWQNFCCKMNTWMVFPGHSIYGSNIGFWFWTLYHRCDIQRWIQFCW